MEKDAFSEIAVLAPTNLTSKICPCVTLSAAIYSLQDELQYCVASVNYTERVAAASHRFAGDAQRCVSKVLFAYGP